MTSTKQIICVKWGSGYGPEYVNRLYGMARRHVTGPFRLICYTDNREGLRPEVEAFDLPALGVPHPQRTMGKWRKVALWGSQLEGLTGVALFVDLDTIIVDSLDPYFSYGSPDDVILARNWAKPLRRLGQTSVFRFPVGRNSHILDNFRADPQGVADRFRFEQHYITHSVKGGIKLWPEGWTWHFRLHCLPVFPLRYFRMARIPKGARLITFPGGPNPGDVVEGRWAPDSPPYAGRWAHVKSCFAPGMTLKQRWRKLRRFVIPVTWIRDHWRE